MELGMPTLIELESLEENASFCKEVGLAFLELNMNLPAYQVEELEQTDWLRNIKEKYGVYYTIHLEENLDVCEFNRAVQDAYLDTVKRTIEAALKIKVPILNMHMAHGVHFTLPDRKIELYEKHEDRYFEAIRKFRNLCESEIGDETIRICIENTDGYREFEKKAIEYLLESKVFGLTWDIGHSYVAGEKDLSFIKKHEKKLVHFHIHDAKKGECHLPLGSGESPVEKRLLLAKRNGCRGVVETKTASAIKTSMDLIHKMEIL